MKDTDLTASIVVNPDGNVYEASVENFERGGEISPRDYKRIARFDNYGFSHEQGGARSATIKNGADAMLSRDYARALKSATRSPQHGLTAASTGTALAENLAHLQLIRLFPDLQGEPDDYFFLDAAFVVRPIPKLQLRESYRDAIDAVQ